MAGHKSLLFFAFIGVAIADLLSIRGLEDPESTEDDDWTYSLTPSPRTVQHIYTKKFSNESSMGSLLTDNPTIHLLMDKAKHRSAKLEMRLLQWTDYVTRLAMIEKQLKQYVENNDKLEPDTLVNYAEWCVSLDSGAIKSILDKIHNLVVPVFKDQGLLDLVNSFSKDANLCDLQLSAHQLILDIYNTIALTEVKGFAMMEFSWALLREYNRGNFTQEEIFARQRYTERTEQTATAARAALAKAKRVLYRCNPPSYNSKTYAEVTRLLQGYVENEVDANPDKTCKKTCAHYTITENHGCYEEQFCSQQPRCEGRIRDCRFVESHMSVCPANFHSSRRYEFIKYDSGTVLGKLGNCTRGMTEVNSWWRFWFHCSYCLCLCDESSHKSHRYFSLRPSVSDIAHNKVVTGVRLVKIGRVFHLQIYEGTLLERGLVESSQEVRFKAFDPWNSEVHDGLDYHKLTYERRAIDLDELEAPSGSVLTGVRFQMIDDHLHFEIRTTPFNYTTGKLWPEESQWISDSTTEELTKPTNRSRLELYKPDLPTRGDKKLYINSTNNQYIEFTHSDFDADAAQSTVPFVDVQPVLPSKASNSKGATLNSGAGLYHRGARGSGGFIGVKLLTFDYSKHLKAEPLPENLDAVEDDGYTTDP